MHLRWLLPLLLALCLPVAQASPARPATAFFYGAQAPLDELNAFDWVVLEPDHFAKAPNRAGTDWFAYVSVGEVEARRDYAHRLPASWLPTSNPAWGGKVIDQSQPEWPAFFVDQIVAPLWGRGWRHFFLDTLDSWQLLATTPAEREAQQAGLLRALRLLKQRYPTAQLLFNRGFELLPQARELAAGVAFESLHARWNPQARRYEAVPQADRDWLLAQVRPLLGEGGLPVIALDYLPAEQRGEARTLAEKIRADGLIPWIATPEFDTLGVGEIEVMPRKVMVLYDGRQFPNLTVSDHVRYLAMPLNYLGLVPEYVDIRQPVPAQRLAGRYAGVVAWLNSDDADEGGQVRTLVKRARSESVPVVFLSRFGSTDRAWLAQLDLKLTLEQPEGQVHIVHQHPQVGFEQKPYPRASTFLAVEASKGTPWLSLNSDQLRADAVAITPWGGYALEPFVVEHAPGNEEDTHWVIQPLEFLRTALQLPAMPVPDVTTENGRRLWLTHIDGDGFPSLAEVPGSPTAAEVMRRDFIERYRVPHTVSVIEAEVSPNGLWAGMAPALQQTARAIFALPHVEIASHTYTHPFYWQALTGQVKRDNTLYGLNLKVADYTFSAEREIAGSARYIDTQLAPAGKRTQVLLWTGDCDPDGDTVAETYKAGLRNMNAGETRISRSKPSWTHIAPLGLMKKGYFQTYAPNQNENIYTNDWTGPYWGFRRVIETFEMTDRPLRFKPINLYYHTYSASRKASIEALHEVYRWILKQETLPLFASAYIDRVAGFNQAAVARTPTGWRLRGLGALRTMRVPAALLPDLTQSAQVAGWRDLSQGRYLHLAADRADVALATRPDTTTPRLVDANAMINQWQVGVQGGEFALEGGVPLEFTLQHPSACTLSQGGQQLKPAPVSGAAQHHRYRLARHAARFVLACPR